MCLKCRDKCLFNFGGEISDYNIFKFAVLKFMN